MGIKHSLVTKITGLVITFLLVINVSASWWIYGQITQDAKIQIERQMKATLYGISANIDGDRFEALVTGDTSDDLYYGELNTYLNKCLKNNDFKYLYTVCQGADSSFTYCVDAAKPTDSDFVAFGSPLDVTSDVGTTVVERALKEGSAFTEVQYFEQWGYLITGYVTLYNSNNQPVGLLAMDLIASDYYNRINHLSYQVWITLAIATLATGALLTFALVRTLKPLKKIEKSIEEVAKGNLGERIEAQKKDEIGKISRAINQMAVQLSERIGVVRGGSWELTESAEALVLQSQNVKEASRLVSVEAQDIRLQSEEGQVELKKTTDRMQDLEKNMLAVSEKSIVLNQGATRSYECALQGTESVARVSHAMGTIVQTMKGSKDEVNTLSRQIVEATKLVDLIAKIAAKTRILGLNASIEATKEDGKGFKVLAKEIEQLARESSGVAMQTKVILEGIKEESQKVTRGIEKTYEDMEGIEGGAIQMEGYFNEILGANHHMREESELVNQALSLYKDESEYVVRSIQEAQVYAIKLLDNCQNIVAFTQEQFATSEQMLEYAVRLKVLSETLQKSMEIFQIK
ncbi:MAG: methyl-accepting chemotaxis protein [Cellulosilyticaceae bacterium]